MKHVGSRLFDRMVHGPRYWKRMLIRIRNRIEEANWRLDKRKRGRDTIADTIPHEFARGIIAPQIQCLYLISRKQSNEIKLQKLNNSLFITSRNVFAPDRTRQEIQNKCAV